MSPRPVLAVILTIGLLATPLATAAQGSARVYRIGYLGTTPPTTPGTRPVWNAFLEGLRERGYVERQNLVIDARYSEGKAERFADFAAEFVRLNVDLIVAPSTPAARAAKAATSSIPIVTVIAGDPVATGLVQSLARPGGNVTGTTSQAPELGGKQIELLKELLPGLSRVAVMWNPNNPAHRLAPLETAARSLQIQLQPVQLRGADELDGALESIVQERPGALQVFDDPVTFTQRSRIIKFAESQRLPAAYAFRIYVEEGGLLAYDASWKELFRRTGYYVDRLLKGAKPADLPVEQPTKFELMINLKTAKALGLTIPQSVLLRADQVIE